MTKAMKICTVLLCIAVGVVLIHDLSVAELPDALVYQLSLKIRPLIGEFINSWRFLFMLFVTVLSLYGYSRFRETLAYSNVPDRLTKLFWWWLVWYGVFLIAILFLNDLVIGTFFEPLTVGFLIIYFIAVAIFAGFGFMSDPSIHVD